MRMHAPQIPETQLHPQITILTAAAVGFFFDLILLELVVEKSLLNEVKDQVLLDLDGGCETPSQNDHEIICMIIAVLPKRGL